MSDIGHLWNQLVSAVERLRVLEQNKAFYGINASADLIMDYNRTAQLVLGLEKQLGIPQVDSSVTEVKIEAREAALEAYAQQNADYAAEQARKQAQQNMRYEAQAMSDSVKHQFELMRIARKTLDDLLGRLPLFAGGFTPPWINHEIENSRATIRKCKTYLRGKGFQVDDMPGD